MKTITRSDFNKLIAMPKPCIYALNSGSMWLKKVYVKDIRDHHDDQNDFGVQLNDGTWITFGYGTQYTRHYPRIGHYDTAYFVTLQSAKEHLAKLIAQHQHAIQHLRISLYRAEEL